MDGYFYRGNLKSRKHIYSLQITISITCTAIVTVLKENLENKTDETHPY